MTDKFEPYDDICRVCKKEKVNQTKWICDGCSYETLKKLRKKGNCPK